MKILSIGNSFSQDAQRYLHQIAKSDNFDIKCVNLYIGGCPLDRHYNNMLSNEQAYVYQLNGEVTDNLVTLKDTLLEDEWDYISLQQASYLSGIVDSYSPYIEELYKYVKSLRPNAKIIIHQTWAYQDGSDKLENLPEFNTANDMYLAIKNAYSVVFNKINADLLIPCGEALNIAISMGLSKPYRDGFHASFGVGRYLLALCWYKKLTGNNIDNINFNDFDEEVSEVDIKIAKNAVNAVTK